MEPARLGGRGDTGDRRGAVDRAVVVKIEDATPDAMSIDDPLDLTGLYAGVPVGERGGIVIDNHCRTGTPGVYAVGEMLDWFVANSADGDAPDESTVRKRVSPILRMLHAEA